MFSVRYDVSFKRALRGQRYFRRPWPTATTHHSILNVFIIAANLREFFPFDSKTEVHLSAKPLIMYTSFFIAWMGGRGSRLQAFSVVLKIRYMTFVAYSIRSDTQDGTVVARARSLSVCTRPHAATRTAAARTRGLTCALCNSDTCVEHAAAGSPELDKLSSGLVGEVTGSI